jgi:hypothetical protein
MKQVAGIIHHVARLRQHVTGPGLIDHFINYRYERLDVIVSSLYECVSAHLEMLLPKIPSTVVKRS